MNNRREHDRFTLQPMYTRVMIRPQGEKLFTLEGHAYDLSMGGLRFELDDGIEPGSPVGIMLELPLPGGLHMDLNAGPTTQLVAATGTVVWLDDDDANGPVRMAAVFHAFETPEDEQRLFEALATGRYAQAA